MDACLAYPGRATRALVDLDAIGRNVRRLGAHVGDDVELMAVVKADGYGHGAVMVAREATASGATWLGVATVSEGRELRLAGLTTPVLILGPIDRSELGSAFAFGLDISVGSETMVEALLTQATGDQPLPRLHIKVDTGMHRYGLPPEHVIPALRRLEAAAPGAVVGLSSHFAAAESPEDDVTVRQGRLFLDLAGGARRLLPGLVIHLANSQASLNRLVAGATIARAGIAMYGCGITAEQGKDVGLEQSMTVVSRVMRVEELRPGDGVSYGHTYKADGPERIGLIPLGYADGYARSLSNCGWMACGGERLPVRGRVCMDQTVLGGLPERVREGDWVGVAGPALGAPTWDELSATAGTISYELLTSVGRRVARFYHRGGRVVAVRDELGHLEYVDDDNEGPVTER